MSLLGYIQGSYLVSAACAVAIPVHPSPPWTGSDRAGCRLSSRQAHRNSGTRWDAGCHVSVPILCFETRARWRTVPLSRHSLRECGLSKSHWTRRRVLNARKRVHPRCLYVAARGSEQFRNVTSRHTCTRKLSPQRRICDHLKGLAQKHRVLSKATRPDFCVEAYGQGDDGCIGRARTASLFNHLNLGATDVADREFFEGVYRIFRCQTRDGKLHGSGAVGPLFAVHVRLEQFTCRTKDFEFQQLMEINGLKGAHYRTKTVRWSFAILCDS